MNQEAAAQNLAPMIANVSSGATIGFGLMSFLNENAAGIGALCALITATSTLIFYVISYFQNRRKHKNELEVVISEAISLIKSTVNNEEVNRVLDDVGNRRKMERS